MNDIELKLEDYITRADVNVAIVEGVMSEEEALKYVTDVAAHVWFQENMDGSSDDFSSDDFSSDDFSSDDFSSDDFSSDDFSSDDSGDEPEIPTNEIHYTATEKITPNDVTGFGANYLPDESEFDETTSKGILKFDGDVTSIGPDAFTLCSGLISIMIPNTVTSIGRGAFAGCEGLTSMVIPNSVTNIGEVAFLNCTSMTSVTISNRVTTIEFGTFSGCTSLTSVIIPNSVRSIGNEAFCDCTSMTSVTIGDGVTTIRRDAFFMGDDESGELSYPGSLETIAVGDRLLYTYNGEEEQFTITLANGTDVTLEMWYREEEEPEDQKMITGMVSQI